MFVRRSILLVIALLALLAGLAASAAAQTPNPYNMDTGPHLCHLNPYAGIIPPNCEPVPDLTEQAHTIVAIPEGIVNVQGSEYAFVVVTPINDEYQQVVLKFVPEKGDPIYQRHDMWKNRISVGAHTVFSNPTAFSVVVYCGKECAAQLVSRSAANFWAPVPSITQVIR